MLVHAFGLEKNSHFNNHSFDTEFVHYYKVSLQPNTATNSTPGPNPNKQVTHTAKYNVNTGQTANGDDLSDKAAPTVQLPTNHLVTQFSS